MREGQLIDWIRRQGRVSQAAVPVGPGDDCAVVRCGGKKLLITTDQVLDGVHFVLREHGPAAAGRKAMARNLSDVAAVAGVPLAAVATVALPRGMAMSAAKAIYRGMESLGRRFGCPIVGGDVGCWAGKLAITVTILARAAAGGPVLRTGARPGDAICVTGRLGGAWRTRRHLTFAPRIREAQAIAASCKLHAMIDISDGLSVDLGHVCAESKVGAELVASDIPVARGATLEQALGDGEDYELLFALPARQVKRLKSLRLGVPVTRIGTITETRGLVLVAPGGKPRHLRSKGWEHRT
ncbi:MAG TPA: thiamine-phosphate kinase [Phycisphaerae bacterium]|nr:thiamine-phosphate kinase [Phycisphaerae bacterium]